MAMKMNGTLQTEGHKDGCLSVCVGWGGGEVGWDLQDKTELG